MAYQVQVPLAGIAGWRYLERTHEAQKAVFETDTIMQREIAYFEENIGSVTSAADLVADRRLLEFALTAYGLEDDAYKKALVRTILEGGTEDEEALANRITVSGYKEMAEDFGFGNSSGSQTATDGFAAKIVAAYKEQRFETAVGDQNEHLGLAMTLKRKIGELSEGEGKSWYTVLGDKDLRQIFEGAFGLPSAFVNIDIDQQARMIEKKADQMFGGSSLTVFQDETNIDKLILRYLARKQVEEGWVNPGSPAASALTLLQNRDGNGSYGIMNLIYGA
ncbi:MAG: DUF1217 domain-containing protein [Pseudomonadota bacterium]